MKPCALNEESIVNMGCTLSSDDNPNRKGVEQNICKYYVQNMKCQNVIKFGFCTSAHHPVPSSDIRIFCSKCSTEEEEKTSATLEPVAKGKKTKDIPCKFHFLGKCKHHMCNFAHDYSIAVVTFKGMPLELETSSLIDILKTKADSFLIIENDISYNPSSESNIKVLLTNEENLVQITNRLTSIQVTPTGDIILGAYSNVIYDICVTMQKRQKWQSHNLKETFFDFKDCNMWPELKPMISFAPISGSKYVNNMFLHLVDVDEGYGIVPPVCRRPISQKLSHQVSMRDVLLSPPKDVLLSPPNFGDTAKPTQDFLILKKKCGTTS